jgi:hypothetical protein
VIRRTLLWERKDLPGGLAPDFITHSAGFLLNAGWPVIVEGILSSASYGPALRELLAAHRGRSLVYFLQRMVETDTDPVNAELDGLSPDADEPTRQGLAERLGPIIAQNLIETIPG